MTVVMVFGAIAAVVLTVRLHAASDLNAAQPIGPANRAVIFLIDGVSPTDLARVPMPHLADLARRGISYRRAWTGQLEDVGLVSAASLATGEIPRRTGLIAPQWRNPQTGGVERPGTPSQVDLGAVDQVMQSHGATPIALPLKRMQPRAPILAVGGVGCGVANASVGWLADYVLCLHRQGKEWVPGAVTGHALPPRISKALNLGATPVGSRRRARRTQLGVEDDMITRYCIGAMRKTRPSLSVVSFDELATRKPSSNASRARSITDALLRGVDRDIGKIVLELRREGVANRTAFVVTSGAAMPLEPNTLSFETIAHGVMAAGGQRAYIGNGEMTAIGLEDPLQAQPVAQALQDQHLRGMDAIYYKTRTRRKWQYQPQYLDPDLPAAFNAAVSFQLRTFSSDTSPDVVGVLSPGFAVARRGDNGSGGPGVQWDSQHVPLIIAGHGVQAGVQSDYPARIVDVAPTIAALMGFGPIDSDGVVLADALQQPPDGSEDAQRRSASTLGFYVSALQNRQQVAGR